MTDKEIIIDGVDVSGCEYWANSELGYCTIGLHANDGTHICECEHNCYYKQLKRLEAENKKLKDNLSEAEAIILAYKEEKEDWMLRCAEKDNDIEILVSENVKLKQQLAEIGKSWDEIQRLRRGSKLIAELKTENERLKFKLDTVEADYEASEIEIEDLKNKLNLLTTANNHLLELDKYRQKELETKAEATKSNIHNLALLSKVNKTLQEIKDIAERFKSADREESEKLLCLENDMEDILYRIAEVYNEK